MSQATEKNASYLTEAILSIHNEVQSALDYISTVANSGRHRTRKKHRTAKH